MELGFGIFFTKLLESGKLGTEQDFEKKGSSLDSAECLEYSGRIE